MVARPVACPQCRRPMGRARLGPLELPACLACGGLWLRQDLAEQVGVLGSRALWRLCEGLRAAQGSPAASSRSITGDLPGACAECGAPLGQASLPSLDGRRVSFCPACNTYWLRDHELALLAERALSVEAEARERPETTPPGASGKGPPTRPVPPRAGGPAAVRERCAACGQPNAVHQPMCWACGALLLGAPAGNCPRCRGGMHRVHCGPASVRGCDGCGSVAVEQGSLGAVRMQPRAEQARLLYRLRRVRALRTRAAPPQDGVILCPTCGQEMYAAPFGALTRDPVHHCPRCVTLLFRPRQLEALLLHGRG